jgi:hypothetical protein
MRGQDVKTNLVTQQSLKLVHTSCLTIGVLILFGLIICAFLAVFFCNVKWSLVVLVSNVWFLTPAVSIIRG